MREPKFFVCKHCGNLVGMIHDSGVPMICCGEKMQEIIPNTVDAAKEKHVPAVEIEGGIVRVQIGTVEHPMTEEHLIQWVYLATVNGGQRKELRAGEKPNVTFALIDDLPVAVYAYCNLHGLWKTAI
ncbi:MAG: desulfoferrodoxin family protein [Clostridia bacterium]